MNQEIVSFFFLMVLGKGLEPSRLAAPAPKAGVSTNSTTRAHPELIPTLNPKSNLFSFVDVLQLR